MKRFQFRLEGLMRVRRFELDRVRNQLAVIEREWTRRAGLLKGEQARLEAGQALLKRAASHGSDGEEVAMRADAITAGRFRVARAQRALEDLNAPLVEARRRVDHALSRVRSLERLEEKAETEHRRLELKAEQAQLEELAMGRIARAGVEARRVEREAAR
jgi:flagellar export protein FliJ